MNWHFYSLSTDKLLVMMPMQFGKVGGQVPPLDIFENDIKTTYIKYWRSRLTSLYRAATARNRYVQLIEQVIKGHNETFKLYSGIESTLSERAKLLRTVVDETNDSLSAEEKMVMTRRISNCDRQAMAVIQRAGALSDIASWIRDNHSSDSLIIELAEEYERAVLLGKQIGGEILSLYANSAAALIRYDKLYRTVKNATGETYQAITEPLREEINWRVFQRKIISATKEYCLDEQLIALRKMLEVAKIARNSSDAAFRASVAQSDRIKMTVLTEPLRALESPVSVAFEDPTIWVELADGRIVGAPLKWFPKLRDAGWQERDKYKMTSISLIWPTLDTQIYMDDLFDEDSNPLYPIDASLN